jgi:hypothetical protein
VAAAHAHLPVSYPGRTSQATRTATSLWRYTHTAYARLCPVMHT